MGISQSSSSRFAAAVDDRDLPAVRRCLDAGIDASDVAYADRFGRTAQLLAVLEDDEETLRRLLDLGASPEVKEDHGDTLLQSAALPASSEGCLAAVLAAGADVHRNSQGGGAPPLVTACRYGSLAKVEALLRAGADPHEAGPAGWTPLFAAALSGVLPVLDAILATGPPDVNVATTGGTTPLFCACENGHVAAAKVLLRAGADIHQGDAKGQTPLGVAAWRGHAEVVELLLQAGADFNAANSLGSTPLMAACAGGRVACAEALLAVGADVAAVSASGLSALRLASQSGSLPIVRALLASEGCDVNQADKDGWTPLWAAAERGRTAVVAELAEQPDVQIEHQPSTSQCTALGKALGEGHYGVVGVLLRAGAALPGGALPHEVETYERYRAQKVRERCMVAWVVTRAVHGNRYLVREVGGFL